MPTVNLGEATIAFDVSGDPGAEPIVLICGCGQPAVAWHVGVAPALVAAGYQVVTFDNRGVAPSSSPPAPSSGMVAASRIPRTARKRARS